MFKEELSPVKVMIKRKEVTVDVDEHPKPQTTLEVLSKLPLVFKKDGVVTTGSASGICDGAGAVVVASEEAVSYTHLDVYKRQVQYCLLYFVLFQDYQLLTLLDFLSFLWCPV